MGEIDQARQTFEEGLKLAREFNNNLFLVNHLVDLSRIAYDSGQWEIIPNYERQVRTLEEQGYHFGPAYARMEFVLGDLVGSQGQFDKAFDHYGRAYSFLGRHSEWHFQRRLGFIREKLSELPSDQRKRQAERLAEYWSSQKELIKHYPYFVTMCRHCAIDD